MPSHELVIGVVDSVRVILEVPQSTGVVVDAIFLSRRLESLHVADTIGNAEFVQYGFGTPAGLAIGV
ncbi:MAG: hypothetical protein JJ992_22190, partial [Planctomycetes bacterium]|nr:hypothetical protein [Planctomycetota bacterium]